MELKFTVMTKIQKPIAEVFDAVYNPEKLSGYFTNGGASAPLDEETTVQAAVSSCAQGLPVCAATPPLRPSYQDVSIRTPSVAFYQWYRGRVATLGARARDRVLRHFTWDAKAAQVLEVYRWVLGRRPTKPDFGTPLGSDGIVRGDLVVRGGGDPTIGNRSTSGRSLSTLADALWQHGVRRVEGRIVGDARAFAHEPLGEGWAWDDLPFSYSAPAGALIYNENDAQITIAPGSAPATAAAVALADADSGLIVRSRVTTGAAGSATEVDVTRELASIDGIRSNNAIWTGSSSFLTFANRRRAISP